MNHTGNKNIEHKQTQHNDTLGRREETLGVREETLEEREERLERRLDEASVGIDNVEPSSRSAISDNGETVINIFFFIWYYMVDTIVCSCAKYN